MSLFLTEVLTPPTSLPVAVAAADQALAAAVVEELERAYLWRAVSAQTRRITVDGPLPPRIELEPVTAIESLTKWTPTNDAEVIPAANYSVVTRDPAGTIIVPLGRDELAIARTIPRLIQVDVRMWMGSRARIGPRCG